MRNGIDLIKEERERQFSEEGFTNAHDDRYTDDDLVRAALCYLRSAFKGSPYQHWSPVWPWPRSWWKPKGRKKDLIRAGALIAAELDRMAREERRLPRQSKRKKVAGRTVKQKSMRK